MENKKKVTIVTHNGNFHPDDVFGVATLFLELGDSADIEIIRTRDRKITDDADYVVDTGDMYNSDTNRFDHHQKGRAGVRANGIPYASFGLVWKKYGEHVCGGKIIADKIEQSVVVPIDARDNGVDINTLIYPDIAPYEIRNIIWAFRTTWKEDKNQLDANFRRMVDFARELLQREIIYVRDEMEGEQIVLDTYNKTEDKRMVVLDGHYPFDVLGKQMPECLIMVYPDITDGNWCLECVRDDFHSYVSRMLFPKEWAGKNNKELEDVTGVLGAIFCHPTSFFAVARTKETAIKMAEIALL